MIDDKILYTEFAELDKMTQDDIICELGLKPLVNKGGLPLLVAFRTHSHCGHMIYIYPDAIESKLIKRIRDQLSDHESIDCYYATAHEFSDTFGEVFDARV